MRIRIALLVSSLILSSCANGQEYKVIEPINHINNLPMESFKKFEDMSSKLQQQEIHKQENKKKDKGYVYEFEGEITAYCIDEGDKSSDDPEYGLTASLTHVQPHHTIAASRNLPFHSKIKIEGLPYILYVEDRGGAITGQKIDMFVSSHREADKWGRQKRKVYVISLGDNKIGGNN